MKEESEEGSPQEKDKVQVMTNEGHSIISVIDIDQISHLTIQKTL